MSLFDAVHDEDELHALGLTQWPESIDAAVPVFWAIVERFDAAVRATGDNKLAHHFHDLADKLATQLNGGDRCGIAGGEDAPCMQLETRTRAPEGTVPIWGQEGSFIVTVRGCRVRIELAGIYGLCFPSFSAHAVDWTLPFISSTGYRSFLIGSFTNGWEWWAALVPPDQWAREILEDYIDSNELRGKLERIEQRYVDRHAPPTPPEEVFTAVVEEQTQAITQARAAALADVPFSLTAQHAEPNHHQPSLFATPERTDT